jgi:tryptophan synthase alpha subunit
MKQHITAQQIKEIPDHIIEQIFSDCMEDGIGLCDEGYEVLASWMTIGKMLEILEGSSPGQKLLISKLIEYNQALTMGIEWKYSFCDALWKAVKSILSSKP